MMKRFYAFLVMTIFISNLSMAEIPSVSVNSSEFIKNWLLCGPFPNPLPDDKTEQAMVGFGIDYLKPIGGEECVLPADGTSFAAQDGNEYTWKNYSFPAARIDFKTVFKKQNYVLAYAACYLTVEQDKEILLGLGSDDGMKVWLNGKLILETPYGRTACPDENCIPVHVNKGNNLLLVKVDQRSDRWAMYARILDFEAKKTELWYASRPRLEYEMEGDSVLVINYGQNSRYLILDTPPAFSAIINNANGKEVIKQTGSLGNPLRISLNSIEYGPYWLECSLELRYGPLPSPKVFFYHGPKLIRLKVYNRNGQPEPLEVNVLDKNFNPIKDAIEEIEQGLYGVLRPDLAPFKFQVLIDSDVLGRRWYLVDNAGKGFMPENETLEIDLPREAAKALWDRVNQTISLDKKLPGWFRNLMQRKLKRTDYHRKNLTIADIYNIFDELITANYRLPAQNNLNVWAASSIEKIGRNDVLPKDELNAVHIALAKHEYEAVQIILRPDKNINDLEIELESLISKGGDILDIENISINMVDYVDIKFPSNAKASVIDGQLLETGEYPKSFGTLGMWPDPLPKLKGPFSVTANTNTPLWVTIYAPANQPAGLYQGKINIKSNGKVITSVSVQVNVFNFTLPQETNTATAYGMNINEQYHGKLTKEQRDQVWDCYTNFCASHRITPYDPHRYARFSYRFEGNPKEAVLDFTKFDSVMTIWFDEHKLTSFNMGGLPGKIDGHARYSDEYNILFKNIFSQVQEHLREKGWLEKAYWYWTDEPQKNYYAEVKKGMELLKWACPDIRRLLTLHVESAPVEYFYNAVNLWVPVMYCYDMQKAHARQKLGETVWWYVCTGPKGPYPNDFIDHPAINHRIRYWMMDKYGLDGDLYWRITYWDRHNPWKQAMSINDRQTGIWGNGDGFLVYPPRREKSDVPIIEPPVTSIRFECLRDGLEDREYLWKLAQISGSEKKQSIEANEVLSQAHKTLIQSMTCYEQSSVMLLAMRYKIANIIEKQ